MYLSFCFTLTECQVHNVGTEKCYSYDLARVETYINRSIQVPDETLFSQPSREIDSVDKIEGETVHPSRRIDSSWYR